MSELYVYLLFSYMFMIGVALSELASGKKKVSAPYFVAILISPLVWRVWNLGQVTPTTSLNNTNQLLDYLS